MDPSGTFVQCDARAIGSASEGAQSSLQEVYHKVRTTTICLYLNLKCKLGMFLLTNFMMDETRKKIRLTN